MLIIEGADGVGKTTLAKTLQKAVSPFGPLVYRRLGLLPGNWNYYDDYVNRMDFLVIQDRFHLSEWIYGPIARGASMMSEEQKEKVEDDLMMYGALTVIITVAPELVKLIRPDKLYTSELVDDVNDKFIEYANKLEDTGAHLHYHVTDLNDMPASNEEFLDTVLTTWFERLAPHFGYGTE